MRGNFYQVQGALLCQAECFSARQDAELLAIGIDDAQLGRPDGTVDSCSISANLCSSSVFQYVLVGRAS